jgi:hypothetical protein
MVYCQYFDVLGAGANRDLYRMALDKRARFERSRTSPGKYDPDWRLSTVIYDQHLAGATTLLERVLRARLPEVLAALGIPAFDIGAFEIQLTSHNDGEYFRRHTDSGSRQTESRVVTFVYYFHGEPRRFTGGDLVICAPDGREVVVEPRNDSIVFFDACTKHEVLPVSCPSKRFEDGRFTLNGWVRRKEAPVARDAFFDQRIFGPVGQWAAAPPRASQRLAPPAVAPAPASPAGGAARMGALLTLYGNLHRLSRRAGTVDVRRDITGDEFFEEFYCRNRPVLLPGLIAGSDAVRTWSPESFGRRFGHVPVEITSGRERDSDYETRFHASVRTVTMGELTTRLAAGGETNDFYLVARNYFFDNPAFRPLRDELRPPPAIVNDADRSRGTAKLWFGPAGTVTPLHFDEHSILFTQVYGRKRFKLIPSFDYQKMYVRNEYYSAVDPERADLDRYPLFGEAAVGDVVVEPGDGLFLPAGWWHWARALDVSISATFSSFRVDGRNTQLGNARSLKRPRAAL